ncbi:helix-turn-helix transcriptional regulator [Embleya sp. NBC_00888]|uniref:helix-turn-helix domain-containing protein n=1 Tax=Embleya sp. NBC_00888 TaxID=2975960 RepID=UPI003870E3F8|nr:helix-turn-helix transcriptional regulator [Embleya sp. NBC_00888]
MADPMVQRRLVGKGLRTARTEADISQSEAAKELEWSASKLTRIEKGDTAPSKNDLEAALRLYEVWGTPIGEELVERGIEARKKPWWQEFLDPTAGTREGRWGKLLSFESEAVAIDGYEPSIIPGLLQTEAYGREVLRHLAVKPGQVENLARLRSRRREEVYGEGRRHPRVRFVLDEAVVLRRIGAPRDPSIMVAQLRYLKDQVTRHHIDLRVIPFDRGMHAGLSGPISIYEFETSGLDAVAFVKEAVFVQDGGANEYLETFQALHDLALSPEKTMRLIDSVIDAMSTEVEAH